MSYRVTKYPPNISKEKVDIILRKAFNIWQEAGADISFTQWNQGNANIEIRLVFECEQKVFCRYLSGVICCLLRFEEGSHGDGQPFDGAQVSNNISSILSHNRLQCVYNWQIL